MDFITVSPHPTRKKREDIFSFDLVINVSDHIDFSLNKQLTEKGIETFWFPFGETFQMPLENIYAAMRVLWEADQNKKRVLLHCAAGRNRSVMIEDCYHFMKTGHHRPNSQLIENINDNQLPGLYRMESFLEKCRELFENLSLAKEAYVDWLKKETFGY